MSYKLNKKDPTRRARLLARRNKVSSTDASQYFMDHLYVPGNGPHHRLGRNEKSLDIIKRVREVRKQQKRRIIMARLGIGIGAV